MGLKQTFVVVARNQPLYFSILSHHTPILLHQFPNSISSPSRSPDALIREPSVNLNQANDITTRNFLFWQKIIPTLTLLRSAEQLALTTHF